MNQPEAEATETCLHCGGPMKPASRRNLRKDFCRDACRVAHRDARIRAALAEAVAAVEEVRDSLDQGMARLSGALQLLAQATVKGKPRKPKPAAPHQDAGNFAAILAAPLAQRQASGRPVCICLWFEGQNPNCPVHGPAQKE